MSRPRKFGLLPTSTITDVVYGQGIHVSPSCLTGGIPLRVISPGEDTAHLGIRGEIKADAFMDLNAIRAQSRNGLGKSRPFGSVCGQSFLILPSLPHERERAMVFPPPWTKISIANRDRSIEFHFSGEDKPHAHMDYPNLTVYVQAKAFLLQPNFGTIIDEIEALTASWFVKIDKTTLQRVDVAIDVIGVPVESFIEFFLLKAVTSRLAEKNIFADGLIQAKGNWRWQGATVNGEDEHVTFYDKIAQLTNPEMKREKQAEMLYSKKWPGKPDCSVTRIEIRLRGTVKKMKVVSRAGFDHPRAWVHQRPDVIRRIFEQKVVLHEPPVNRRSSKGRRIHPVWKDIGQVVCALALHPDWDCAVQRQQGAQILNRLNARKALRQSPIPTTAPQVGAVNNEAAVWGWVGKLADEQGIRKFDQKAMERMMADLIRRQIQAEKPIPSDLAQVVGLGAPGTFTPTGRGTMKTIQ